MRLKTYLTEGRTKSISKEQGLEFIKKNCGNILNGYLKGGSVIHREIEDFTEGYGIVDPTKGKPRKSRNTSNHYTLLMDNLPSWKGYPKRSRSLICSIYSSTTKPYKGTTIIFPENKCTIGICSSYDLWESFTNILRGMDSFNHDLDKALIFDDVTTFKNLVRSLENPDYEDDIRKLFSNLNWKFKESDGILDILNKEMDPKKNGFELVKSMKLLPVRTYEEVWIGGGKSVVIAFAGGTYKDFKSWWGEL